MLLGPWSQAKFQSDVCTLIDGKAESFDSTSNKSRKLQREEAAAEAARLRDTTENRGLSGLHAEEINIKKLELAQKDLELGFRREIIDLEKSNMALVVNKESTAKLTSLLDLNQKVMDTLSSRGLTKSVDKNGLNRYEQAEKNYWDAYDKLNA